MARNQTFSVSLSLLTKNFQRGVKTVQTSLNNLKMQFRNFAAALGAGIGFTEVIRNMVDSAKQLDKAQTVLKNVSNGIGNYAQNQQFVMDLSKKYNQELTSLMNNYAKFHSAANMANMSMEEQTKIYEALTRAGAYYSLTADEMNGVMLAVNQMISKGKVSSEELRRQLGERLPGAMNLAAKAMGVTTAELDKMIRDGEVLATDLLPKLADELNGVTGNLDVNTLQGGLNRLKNSFTNLTKNLNIGELYKKIVNSVADGLDYIAKNLTTLKNQIYVLMASIFGHKMWNKLKGTWQTYAAAVNTSLTAAQTKVQQFSSSLISLEKRGKIKLDIDDKGIIRGVQNINMQEHSFRRVNEQFKGYQTALDEVAVQTKANTRLQKAWNTILNTTRGVVTKVGAAFKSLWSSFAPMLIIYAVGTIIQKFVEWRKEVERIKNLVKDTMAELNAKINTPTKEELELEGLKITDTTSDEDRKKMINTINMLLGTQFDINSSNEEINNTIDERLKLLKEEKTYQENIAKIIELNATKQEKLVELEKTKKKLAEKREMMNKLPAGGGPGQQAKLGAAAAVNKFQGEVDNLTAEIAEIDKAIQQITANNAELVKTAGERQQQLNPEDNDNGDDNSEEERLKKLKEDYAKIQSEYNNSLRALKDKKKDGLINEEEYNKALEDLYKTTLDSIYALNNINENTDPFAKALKENYLAILANKKEEDKVQEALDEYYEGVQKLYNQYNNGVITQEELETELYNLLEEVVKTTSAMGDLAGTSELLAAELSRKKKELANKKASEIENPTSGTRDNTFDYTKTDSDILGEVADIYREYEDNLKNTIEELSNLEPTDEIKQRLQELNAELLRTTYNAETMEDAFKFAKISEDIKSLEQELSEGIWDNFTGIADAVDRVTSSIKDMVEVMEDPETDGWEKVLSLFNAITQITDTILQSVQMISQLTEVMDKLKQAEAAYQAVQAAGTAQTVAGAATTVVAKQAEATASGTAEAAKLPFPANLLAILGIVGLITSIFAGLPKFAHGGIVQGASTIGDNNLARVNAGEMILNKQQQATLFGMLNGSNSSALGKNGGQVEFKIKGADLVGTINNYNSRKRG